MNLGQIRSLLVERTGRFDLSRNTSKAASFINEGQSILDGLIEGYNLAHFVKMTVNSSIIHVKYLRSVSEVWLTDDEDRILLNRVTERKLESLYPDLSPDSGQPKYYAMITSLRSPDQRSLLAADFATAGYLDYGSINFGATSELYDAIKVGPPPNEAYGLKIIGEFASLILSADTDVSYWSVAEPYLLVNGARAALERAQRNDEGFRAIMNSMEVDVRRIIFNQAKREDPGGQMQDSWV